MDRFSKTEFITTLPILHMPMLILRRAAIATVMLVPAGRQALGQQVSVTAAQYAHAERFLAPATFPLVFGSSVRPTWLPNDRFWYRTNTPSGVEFILVDPGKGTRARAFDPAKLASGLSAAAGGTYSANQLPFNQIDVTPNGTIRVRVAAKPGELNQVKCETGVIFLDRRPFVLSVASTFNGGDHNPLQEMIRIFFHHFEMLNHSNRYGRSLQ